MTLLSALVLLTVDAHAAWPDDVNLTGMTVHAGQPIVDPTVLAEDYDQLIRELGMAVGTRSIAAPHTLGLQGFELAVDGAVNFIDSSGPSDNPSPWERAHIDENPSAVMVQPGFSIRKGLPFSLEVGLAGRSIGVSRQGVISGQVRAGLVEGFKPFPDVNLHMGYSGYVGNDQLKLGVFDVGVTLGARAPVGPLKGARNGSISPYADVTLMVISSTPTIDEETYTAIGASTFGNRGGYPEVAANRRPLTIPTFNGGLQVNAGRLMWRVSGGYGLKASAWVATSLGFNY